MVIWYDPIHGFCMSEINKIGREIDMYEFIGLYATSNYGAEIRDILKDMSIKATRYIYVIATHQIIYEWDEY